MAVLPPLSLACLMLHGIGPVPPHVGEDEIPYWVSRETFAFILGLMRQIPARLTFDDGNASDAAIALPALIDARMTASFFIPTARIGTPGYVDENDIRALHGAGMEIGSHGCTHQRWTEMSDSEIAQDVTASVERLSAIIGEPVRTAAIPFGHCDRRVLAVLRRLGLTRVYSSFRGPDSDARWLVRRDCITAGLDEAEIRTLLTRKPALAESALTLLKSWRRAGNAALWAA